MQRLLCLLALTVLAAVRTAAQTEGIFADFKTSLGSFTCRLDYAVAPKAVANFVGLATGEMAWLDLNTGRARREPFYDGLIFHRVIKGFMNQCGSPNGLGNDGPGYAFADEFSPEARHDGAGVLSMANSGPNSNGAQFFVTAAATPWLNDLHTVFGRVVGGLDTVMAINGVTTANERPLTNVVLHSVTVRRVGAAAEAFDIRSQGLPSVTNPPFSAAVSADAATLSVARGARVHTRIFSSTNLVTWNAQSVGITTDTPVAAGIDVAATNREGFFRVAQVQYEAPVLPPSDLSGRTLNMALRNGAGADLGVISVQFDGLGGTYTYSGANPPAGTLRSYLWIQDTFRTGRLWPIRYSALVDMTIRLDFTSATAGSVSGTAYSQVPFTFTGTFTLTGP